MSSHNIIMSKNKNMMSRGYHLLSGVLFKFNEQVCLQVQGPFVQSIINKLVNDRFVNCCS